MAMSEIHRAFLFNGTDKDYIKFLEAQLSAALNRVHETVNDTAISLPRASTSASSNVHSSISAQNSDSDVSASIADTPDTQLERCDSALQVSHPTASSRPPSTSQAHFQFLYFDPINGKDIDLPNKDFSKLPFPKQTSISEPQGMRELRKFVNDISKKDIWKKRKRELGLTCSEVNKTTVEALCGRSFSPDPREEPISCLDNCPSDRKTLILRGCDYGALLKRRRIQGNLILHIAKYQKLIFVSLCVVLLESGTPRDVVDWMMRHFISDTGPENLRRLRYGSIWVNRCISKLLDQNWGFRSWELFFYFPRTIEQYGRFANTKNSFDVFATDMGSPEQMIPYTEDGFVPYCIPCFIKMIAGDELQLVDICNILGYSILHVSPIYESYFNNEPLEFNPFIYAYGGPTVDFNPFTYAHNGNMTEFDPMNASFSGSTGNV